MVPWATGGCARDATRGQHRRQMLNQELLPRRIIGRMQQRHSGMASALRARQHRTQLRAPAPDNQRHPGGTPNPDGLANPVRACLLSAARPAAPSRGSRSA